ncbi:helix-turn-helix domain-containing protein [Brooklawnia sp.]|uniref:helix-turn-helix domain-containing protein n=1 Tax=Brooklawnia sp. TaxID=2699740 RepID=UPI003C776FB9
MIRQHANLTRAEVARAVGVDPSTVSRWESGERRPRGAAAARYADLLRRLSLFEPEGR